MNAPSAASGEEGVRPEEKSERHRIADVRRTHAPRHAARRVGRNHLQPPVPGDAARALHLAAEADCQHALFRPDQPAISAFAPVPSSGAAT